MALETDVPRTLSLGEEVSWVLVRRRGGRCSFPAFELRLNVVCRIPSLSQLRGLEILDLSNNNLSGKISKSLGNLTVLCYLNLSFNTFAGELPDFGVFANITGISIQETTNFAVVFLISICLNVLYRCKKENINSLSHISLALQASYVA
ncbi:hypothetical protein EJB05_27373, partial [Eragrostis curvula]